MDIIYTNRRIILVYLYPLPQALPHIPHPPILRLNDRRQVVERRPEGAGEVVVVLYCSLRGRLGGGGGRQGEIMQNEKCKVMGVFGGGRRDRGRDFV